MRVQDIPITHDAYIDSNNPDTNYGNEIFVQCDVVRRDRDERRGYIRIETAAVPANWADYSAIELHCYMYEITGSLPASYAALIFHSSFDEAFVTWNAGLAAWPGDVVIITDSAPQWIIFPLRISDSGFRLDRGVMIWPGSSAILKIRSSEDFVVSERPFFRLIP